MVPLCLTLETVLPDLNQIGPVSRELDVAYAKPVLVQPNGGLIPPKVGLLLDLLCEQPANGHELFLRFNELSLAFFVALSDHRLGLP